MYFDITNIDKVALLQALYAYSEPAGYGQLTYKIKDHRGEQVNGLTLNEARNLLSSAEESVNGIFSIVDYHNGKPLKFSYRKKQNGQIVASTTGFDTRNGKFRFFEAMLNTFAFDEIIITQKSYPSHIIDQFDLESLQRPQHQEKLFKKLISTATKHRNPFGNFWQLNEQYKHAPEFLYNDENEG